MVELNDILTMQSDDEIKKNEAVKELFKFENIKIDIKTKTDLTLNDIKQLTRLKLLSKKFNIGIIDDLCDTYCLFLVSKDRLGRKEVVDMMHPKDKIEPDSKSLFRKFFNRQ